MKQPANRKESSGKKHSVASAKGESREQERKLLTIVLVLVVAVLLVTSYSALNMTKALPKPDGETPGVNGDLAAAVEDFLAKKADKTMKGSIAVQSLKASTAMVLDVRTETLRKNGYIADSLHIPLKDLMTRLSEIPNNKIIVVYCQNNINAAYAAAVLNMQGYNAYVLENGIDAWIAAGGETTMLSPPPKRG